MGLQLGEKPTGDLTAIMFACACGERFRKPGDRTKHQKQSEKCIVSREKLGPPVLKKRRRLSPSIAADGDSEVGAGAAEGYDSPADAVDAGGGGGGGPPALPVAVAADEAEVVAGAVPAAAPAHAVAAAAAGADTPEAVVQATALATDAEGEPGVRRWMDVVDTMHARLEETGSLRSGERRLDRMSLLCCCRCCSLFPLPTFPSRHVCPSCRQLQRVARVSQQHPAEAWPL